MPSVHKYREDTIIKVCARTVITAGSANLVKYFDELRDVDPNKFKTNEEYRTQGFNEEGKYMSNDVKTVGHLCYHEPPPSNDKEMHTYLAAVIMQMFEFGTVPFKDDLLKFITKLMLSFIYNYTHVLELHKKGPSHFYATLALAIYPVYNLLNHSCFPNTVKNFYGKTLVLRALRSIPKGEQVFIAMYGCNYFSSPRVMRQMVLQKAHFNCHCEVCDGKWPVLTALPAFPSFSSDEKAGKAKYECTLNRLMRNVKTRTTHWQVSHENLKLFYKHVAVMDKMGKVKNQHYLHMVMCLRKYYLTCGNCEIPALT